MLIVYNDHMGSFSDKSEVSTACPVASEVLLLGYLPRKFTRSLSAESDFGEVIRGRFENYPK
jgi:hypothetical protein